MSHLTPEERRGFRPLKFMGRGGGSCVGGPCPFTLMTQHTATCWKQDLCPGSSNPHTTRQKPTVVSGAPYMYLAMGRFY